VPYSTLNLFVVSITVEKTASRHHGPRNVSNIRTQRPLSSAILYRLAREEE
jgi:hypothetical protein